MNNNSVLLIEGISVAPDIDESGIFGRAERLLRARGIDAKVTGRAIYRRSVDARHKNDIRLVYTVALTVEAGESEREAIKSAGIKTLVSAEITPEFGSESIGERPLVVGAGPCGLFAALLLAENGYRPIMIERGGDIESRKKAKAEFYKTHILNTETNIQFGAGGAGTFSDGKLVTRINDEKCGYLLRRFVEFGAPEDILVNAKPHIGTDKLSETVKNLTARVTALGGEIRYNCRLDGITRDGDKIIAHTTDGDIPCGVALLAVGHSARDTYTALMKAGYAVQAKPFSVGLRVEHLQEEIDRAIYGKYAGHSRLGHAEYSLSHREGERGVYSFCMCPGGEVVAAASEEGGIVVNGMSDSARSGKNANSAIAVNVLPADFGGTPEGAVEYQRGIERAAFLAGGGEYRAPCMTLGDFMNDKTGSVPTKVMPSYMNGNVEMRSFSGVLPDAVINMLKKGFSLFGTKIKGFDAPYALLTGVETRTSSPVRILRREDMTAVGNDRVYPCGEGAGYAGGISSAAIDGINAALSIMSKYKKEI